LRRGEKKGGDRKKKGEGKERKGGGRRGDEDGEKKEFPRGPVGVSSPWPAVFEKNPPGGGGWITHFVFRENSLFSVF